MKKTLAIVLALVMVLSVMAMIPASAAESVLGWELLNPNAPTAKLEKVDDKTVKLSGKGYYGDPNNCAMMVSSEKVDISKGFKLTIADATGFVTDAADSWIVVGFVDKKQPTFTDASELGAAAMFKPTANNATPFTISDGEGQGWENWGSGINFSTIGIEAFGNGEKVSFDVEVAKSSGTHEAFFVSNGGKTTNLLEGRYNGTREAKIDKTLSILQGKAYVFVAISASKVANNSEDANTLATSLIVSGLKAEAAPVEPETPATGDASMVYAIVALISCAVVTGTIILKKREEN